MDGDGYPTEEFLSIIKNFQGTDVMYIVEMVTDNWYFGDWGYKIRKNRNGVINLELHTGGWSGNEEIIREILGNIYLTHFKMKYVMWKTGGHYYFKINDK